MKKFTPLLLIILLFISTNSFSQNIGIGTTTPVASAKLDVTSTNTGFLPPRLNETARDAIIRRSSNFLVSPYPISIQANPALSLHSIYNNKHA